MCADKDNIVFPNHAKRGPWSLKGNYRMKHKSLTLYQYSLYDRYILISKKILSIL